MAWTQDHVHLRFNDYEAALRFFEENLDATEERRLVAGDRMAVEIRMGGALYKISPRKTEVSTPHHEVYHLGLATNDVQGEMAKMRARGVKVVQEPGRNPFAEGPEGISIELMQHQSQ